MKQNCFSNTGLLIRIRNFRTLVQAVTAVLVPSFLFWTPVYSNPRGGVVVHGDVQFSGTGGNLQIRQNSRNAIINWEDFSIDAGELTQFRQPNSSAAVLNRVTGGNPTAIHGALRANGNVFVINPNGILIGAGGTIDVHGLVLSTLDVSNGEFLAGGDMVFKGDSDAGVTNMGRINGIGGDVFLIGKTVTNSGSITAAGTVGLGAGEEVLLTAAENANGERMFVRSTGSGASGTGVLNDGTIEGAAVELKAHGNIYALAINNKGSIRATGATNRGGSVFLEGTGGRVDSSGDISVTSLDFSGSAGALIQAAYAKVDGSISAVNGDGSGGSIRVTGTDFSLVSGELDVTGSSASGGDIVVEGEIVSIGSTASLDASGVTGGGQVQIGGGFQGNDEIIRNAVSTTVSEGAKISADSQESGNAGTVIVWSDVSTEYRGAISAEALGGSGNGGFVEVSGKEFLTFDGIVSTLSANGRNGTLLLDPTDLTVSNAAASANNVNVGDLTTALGSNNVVISTNPAGAQDGDIRINDHVDYTSANDLTFLAHGNIEMIRRVQNQGDGDVNLVAGWDGATGFSAVTPGSAETGMVDMSLFFDDSNTYGNNGGSVVMTANSQRVSAGSRFGDTNVAAYGVDWLANGWGSTAQFGIYDADGNAVGDAATGNIRVDVHNAITATSPNQNASFGSFQIGHGGVGADTGTGPGDLSGNIVVNTGVDGKGTGDISFVFNTTGDVERFYMQIGHGGRRAHGEHSGDITIDTTAGTSGNLNFEAGTAARNYVMIGHGGENIGNNVAGGGNSTRPLDHTGEITVRTKGDITFKAGEVRGAVPADAWRNTADAFAQLGHGGRNADGSHSGTIIVESGGNLLFESGDQQRNFAQLGHGGGSSDGDHSGDITVDVDGTITFDGRGYGGEPVGNNRNENYVQLGNGGYAARGDHSGTISVTSGDDISFFSGNESPGGISAYRSYAQLGHGGAESDSPNNDASSPGMSGTITVNSGGDLRFVAGDADEAYVQLGHGGLGTKGQHSDNISVTAVGDMEFIAGQRQAYAQFGHGGYDADGTHSGSLSADVGGNVTFQGGLGDQGRDFRAYAQFGHGGYGAGGAHNGDISLSADGSISFAAGRLADNYAQLGHGGRGSRSNSNTVGLSGDIDVSAGTGITFTAGTMLERSTANGFNDGSPYASLPNDANLSNGDEGIYADGRLYAQLGHGGYDADASTGNTYNAGVGHTGDIRVVTANGDISFSGGSTALGSSGNDEGRFHSAQIGHGGVASLGDHSGAIEVEATNGSVNFTGGAQTKDGDVNNSTGVIEEDRTDVYNFAAIGHSANFAYWGVPSGNSVGRFSADSVGGTLGLADGINVTAGNAVTFQAGEGRRSYVQLGLGGYESRGLQDGLVDHQGNISVSAGAGGVNFIGGTNTSGTTNAAIANNNSHGRESFAQLGHGGYETDGTFLGDISVTTTNGGNVRFIGGVRADNYVQMGHGGRNADSGGSGVAGGNDGDITVNSDGDVQFIAGTLFEPTATGEDGRIYSLLGHGGYESDAFVGGTLVAGSGHTGDITVNAGGIVDVIGGNTAEGSLGGGEGRVHFAQIGHGGYLSTGEHAGSVNVTAGGAVDVLGGRSSDDNGEIWSHARIGHGGRGYTWGTDVRAGTLDSTSLNGNPDGVNVRAGGNVRIVGGLDRSHAAVGLGGHEWDGNHNGDVSVINTSGNILIQAGEREQTSAIIGNGGHAGGGNVSGDITVISAGTLQAIGGAGISDAWGGTNEGHESFAQIGHGGRESDGNASGDIVVRVAQNFELIAGQNGGYRNYVQIGHGGERMNGTQSGLISVKAGSGLSRIVASQGLLTEYGDESYAQIGHGGYAASGGNKSGNIEVIITDGGGLDLVSGASGSGGNAYAQIGHGGTSMAGTDEVSGNITAIIDGELSLERNEAQTQIAHRGGTLTRQAGGVQSDLTVIAGTIDTNINGTDDLFVINDQTANSQVRNVWLMPYLSNDIGDVTFGTSGSGSLHVAQDINYNSTSNLTFVSGTNFHSTERILNEDNGSTGNVNIVAGWDGTTGRHTLDFTDTVDFEIVEGDFDIAPIQADGIANGSAATSFGNNNGVAVIGRAPDGTRQGDWTAVGSAQGETNVFGRDVLVAAGRQDPANDWSGAAQIGMRDYTTNYDITGDIHVQATRDVSILAGDQVAGPDNPGAREAFAMIGHGGVNENARARDEISGNIYVDAGRNVTATAGTNRRAFVQIGHGGVTGYNAAEELQRIGGDIDVLARSGNIAFTGGTGLEAFAHLGHGGRDLDPVANVAGGISSDIVARAGGDISFVAGTGGLNGANDSYAQLGHGGAFSDANRGTTNGWFGDIQVEAGADGSGFTQTGGEIDVVGGSEHRNYAQIGHGGRSVKGSHQGHMEVRTSNGAIDVVAGTGLDSGDTQNFAQIGHGGYDSDGDLSGDIAVHATNGVTLDASQGTQQHGFVQIGHGGYASSGSHSGFVTVTNTDSGDITLAGGSGANDQAAQIGHGGGSNGNFDLSGSISVVNLGGGVSLSSGDGSWRGAIIGHGDAHDAQTGGARTGGLNVYANGAVTLADGGGNSGAYISHQTNAGIGSVSYAGSGIQANGDSGYSVVSTGGITFSAKQLSGPGNAISLSETIGSALAQGDIALASGGAASDLDLGAIDTTGAIATALSSYNSSNDVVFAAGRNLTVGFGMQNEGDGDIGLIAGWDSDTIGGLTPPQMDALDAEPHFDPASGLALGKISIPDFGVAIPLPANCAEFGNNGGDIVLGNSGQATPVRIGSREGTTSVLGDSVTLNAGNNAGAATQVGFFTNGSGAATGAINVGVHSGGLTMNSGIAAGAYTMIGHGGSGATDEAINADVTVSFCDPSILDMNANGDGAFSQIGHGVQGGSSAIDGNISAEGFSNLTMNGGSGAGAYVQIGHGGNLSSAGVDEAAITLTGASLNGQGGAGDGSFVMVGHGGLNETRNATNDGVRAGFAEATRSGDVDVTLTGNFDMTGGSGQSSFVQVGHGGRRNNAVNGEGHSGAITISSRSFDIFGGAGADSFGMAGHGGYQTTGNHSGDISITTTGPNNDQGRLRLRPDTGGNDDADRAFTQIGHGGYDADFDTASDFTADRYVDNRASTLSGNITLDVAENVVVVAVASNAAGEAYSQVGHGGFDTTGSFGGAGESIHIDAGNAIIVQGGQIAPTADTVGRGNYAQIGHGGAVNIATGAAPHEGVADPNLNAAANGSYTGDITINSASINIDAGIDNENYAQIGHGGINSGNGGAHTGDISMTTSIGSIRLQGGPGGGANAHAMIGHGGRNVNGDHNGSITLNSGQNILLEASGANDAFSQIGHGGRDSDGNLGTATDVISATAAGFVRLRGGPMNSYAHIGLGGYLSDGDKVLDSISVVANGVDTSATGNGAGVLVSGGNGDRAYAHIGNGGAFAYGSNFAGDVTVTATAGGVSVIAPDNRNQTYAMIGHGGRFDRANNGSTYNIGTMTSDITVSALGADSDILVDGGGGTSFAQIGLGGFQAGFSTFGPASFNGAIDIEAGRDVILQGGVVVAPANSNGFAQIGHGGREADAVKSGEIAIDLGRNLSLTGGGTQLDIARTEQYAQIGHGGRAASGEINGDILINQGGGAGAGSVSITGGDSDRSYAQVGHGGHGYTGDIGQVSGAILLTTVGNIDVHGGSDQEAYAQIGHGGDSADAAGVGFNGALSVTSTSGNISLLSNPGDVAFANRASARIGHGGLNNNDATGDFTGNIAVNAAAGSVTLEAAAEGSNNSVQIGHGGIGASALSTHNGTIDVTAGTTISVLGGVAGGGDIRFAQIGHGGDSTNGIFSGAITLDAGSDVTLTGGNENRSSALVGHGGFNSDGAKDGAISVTSGGAVALTPGAINQSFAQIGHGGESSEGSIGATEIANITVDAATGVNLAGNQGPTGTAYTQIGHGGLRGGAAGNTIAGAIDVSTDAGDILLSGSRNGTGESYNQIGHGGLASIYDVANQNIGVEATAGAITLSGSASQNHVMIGHGGERSTGDYSGDIDVHSQNNISLTGGRNTDALTQIGHGGSDHVNGAASTLGGEIHVHSTNGSVSVTTLGSINNGSAVQIGHGGYQAALATTTITGDICVVAGTTAEVSAAGGGGDSSYAMIGHGGVRLAGDLTGNIVVTTGTTGVGGVTLTGGDSTNEFAQIGHGGIDSNGNMSGDVYVIADGGGDVTLQGGTNSSTNYAMIGHGDSEGNTSQGRREGGIHIFGTNLSAANGAGLENVNIYHQTQGGLAGNYDGGDGFQIIPDAANVAASAKDDIAVMVTGNFGSGDINYIDSSDVDIVFDGNGMGDILVNSSDDFFFVTGGDVTFLNSYQNAGSGNVTIVAGWNGAGVRPPATVEYADLGGGMFNYCEPTIRESGVQIDFNDCSTFGNEVAGGDTERGTITLGAADQDNAVYVGSRLGRTVAAGYGITLNAGDTDGAATQLGFHNGSVAGNAGNMTGAIDVFAKGGGVTLNAGSALNTYAQIGHGGTGATVNAINAAVTVSFCEPGDVIFNDPGVATAGSGSHAYTQIGHGINDGAPTVNGAVLVDGFRNLTMNAGGGNTAYALIGHGGDNADGNKDGTVTLTGATAIADRGNITLNGGGGNEAFAQIGHGGRDVNNNKFGAIDISNVVDIDLNGGAGQETQAQIGHGGGDASNGPVRGTIDLNLAGNLTLDAGTENEAFAMVGHGGHSSVNMVMLDGADEADINIYAGGYISISGTAAGTPSTAPDENIAPQAFAQIGHGGRGSRGGDGGATAREFHGDISITANGTDANGNAVTLQAGNSNESYAQIGHGGRAAFSYGDGNIDIDAAGNVDLEGGGRSRTYAMIGHGGDEAEKINNFIGNSDGTNTFGTLMGNRGTIDITTTNGGGLFVTGSQAPTGIGADHNDSGAQVGHGGHGTFGNHTGDIILGIDGDVTLTGGANSDNNGDDRNFAIIGHGGENGDGKLGGTISVTSGGSITGTAGNGGVNFVQIGHGGRNTDGEDDGTGTRVLTDAAATITVVAENNIQFDRGIGNDFDTYAMIGHGGTTSRGTKAGAVSVTSNTGDILFGTDTTRTGRGSVSIGHGGRGANGDTSGNITVEATAGDIKFHGVLSTGDANHREGYAQLGHGGRDATGNHGLAGDVIDVDSGGVIEFLAGSSVTANQGTQGREAYAQLGNGGYQSDGDHAGTINVDAASDITFDTRGASGDRSYVQLGHGGFSSNGSFSGDINVNQNVAGGAITFLAGRSASFAQLGHGGRNDAGSTRDNSGADGIANTADDVRVEGSARFMPGTITGDIAVGASDDITFTGGFQAGGTGFAQIGHGGYHQMAAADEGHSGSIEVITSGGAINFTAGQRNAQHAMIGHGGHQSLGNHFGDITVEAATGIAFVAGGETTGGNNIASFAQIGHGGFDSDFDAGRSIGDFGVVNGAGGFNDDIPLTDPGTMTGAISITTTGAGADIVLTGSQGDNSTGRVGYAQFGHGGASNSGDREGTITVESGGAVLLNRGTTDDGYAQIGHGGRSAHGTISNADITVTSANGGKVALQGTGLPATAGTSSRTYAQIGHGGHNADVQADSAVTVTGSGGVDILGGGAQEGYAMIGHGGDSSDAQGTGFDGNVSVTATAGDIVLTSNAPAGAGGNRTFAKIGHGGYVSAAADYSGNVTATATAGSILGTAGVDGNNNYVQIGHGGVANHATTGHTGTINVLAANDITFTGGIDNAGAAGNDREFAMIGHGGANSDGSHSGNVTVEAGSDGTGSITFQAGDIRGTTEGPFAQIGHGGQSHNGDLGGNISVTAATDISMLGGIATDGAYAQIGHGGRSAKGDRTGTISATATNGKVDVIAGLNNNNYAQIGHGGHEGDFTGATGGTTAAETISVTAGTTINVVGAQTDADVIDGIANGAAQSYAQIGHGGQYADGNHLATITVNAGTDLAVTAGLSNQTYAQIGHGGLFNGGGGKGNQAGDIDIDAGGNIAVTGGVRDRSYAQIGHGGFDHDGTKDGNITVDTTGGTVTVTGGSTFNDAYGQIGHGGGSSSGVIGATSGDIAINATGNIAVVGNQSNGGTNYSQIGHGGRSSGVAGESAAGTIAVNSSGGDVLVTGASPNTGESHTQIGHGGILSNYNVANSIIDVDAAGAVTITGAGSQNSTMIGHGGERAAGTQYGGNIFVDAGNGISLTGGSNTTASAQIGHGGAETNANLTGSVALTATGGDITLTGGSNTDAFAQVGHGGRLSRGDKSGAVSVAANAGAVTVQGGSLNQAYAQIGHGGHDADMNGANGGTTAASTITVTALNDVTVNGTTTGSPAANTAPQAYASIGHGGQYTSGNFLGDISVTSIAGGIAVSGGLSNQSNGQIGHGGLESDGSHNANITVHALGDISVTAGSRARSYAQIGNGGESENVGTDTGHICVVSEDGSVLVTGGTAAGVDDDDANAMIGHGGHNVGATGKDGRITVIAADDLIITGGNVTRGFAQVGHGGENSTGALSGDMDILVGGDLTVVGGSDATAYGLLGHGGHNSTSGGSRMGTLDIGVQGTTTLTDAAALATLGHATSTAGAVSASSFHLTTGMLDTAANAAGVTGLIERMAPGGEFEIAVTNGDLTVDGAGAFFLSNTAVDLAATGGVTFEAAVLNGGGGDVNAVAGWDGSTGLVTTIDFNSCEPITELRIDIADIEADSDAFGNNDEEVVVGDGNQTAPIAVGSAGGETNVLAYGVEVVGSDFTAGGLAQIGFNEELFRADTGNDGVASNGDINILAKEGGLTLAGGSQSNASAQVGHGGNGTIAPLGGDISVDLTHGDEDGDLALTGGSGSGANSFAKLGHGGNSSIGAKSGDIDVTAGEVDIRGGVANFTSASIGHGGGSGVGDLSGAIDVEATDEGVVMRAGDGASSGAQIGHGGVNYNGSATAQPVTVDSAGVVTMVGGNGVNSATQIGHGGVNATATELSGNVDVTAAGDIYLLGGTEVNASTQIGHGGNSADGDFGGDVTVDSGSNITLASNGTTGASAKIGHGDDLASPALSGTGEREGDIEVSAGADITMTDAMIGHVNSTTNATATGGSTQIGAARTDPTDPAAGSIIADADSEFQGEDELRFYVPRRANNQVAAGALLNGVSFVGAETDPSETQRIDEFTINILGDRILFPNEHANAFGTGPAPQNAGNFAFYYDTILLEDLPPLPPVQPEPPLPPVPLTDSLFSLLFPDDRTTDDWRREQEEEFSGFNPWGVYYEGFDQYGLYGESIFSTGSGNTLELE